MSVKIPFHKLDDKETILSHKLELQQAFIDTPENPDIHIVWACLLMHEGKYKEALHYAKLGVGFDPKCAGHYMTLAAIYDALGEREEAGRVLELAYSISPLVPGVNWNYALYLLGEGKLDFGYDLYRWRRIHLPGHKRTLKPEWEPGNENEGDTLLIWAEQGLGDIVMNFRFIANIKSLFPKFKKVILEVPEELYTLFGRHLFGIDQMYIRQKDLSAPYHFDQHISLLDLPHCLGICSPDEIKLYHNENYIKPNEHIKTKWVESFDVPENKENIKGAKIGICWAGSKGHANDKNRSANLSDFQPLSEVGTLFALQVESEDTPQYEKPEGMNLLNISAGMVNTDFTSGIVAAMDCIVTVDTFIAHLAGAMGVKTYLLLPYVHEWRWLDGKGDSYWYPSVTMIKQEKQGEWFYPIGEAKKLISEACHIQPGQH